MTSAHSAGPVGSLFAAAVLASLPALPSAAVAQEPPACAPEKAFESR